MGSTTGCILVFADWVPVTFEKAALEELRVLDADPGAVLATKVQVYPKAGAVAKFPVRHLTG